MLDIKFIRENLDKVKKNNLRRLSKANVDLIVKLDEERRHLISEIEPLRRSLKVKRKPSQDELQKLKEQSEKIEKLEQTLKKVGESLQAEMSLVPNMLSEDVPDGKSDEDNIEVKKVGKPKKFDFKVLDHMEIGERLSIIDSARAAKVSGAKFFYLKNDGARLRLALVNYAFSLFEEHGFEIFFTPHLAKTESLFGTGYLPFFDDQIYKLENSDLSLIGTSEQTLVAYHTDEIFKAEELPKLYCGYSACFRTEAGSYGKDTKGIIRVHEFAKVEQIIFCEPGESKKWLEKTIELEERICSELGLPYRKMRICVGDLGAPGYEKFDLEVWFPAQKKYREVTSATNITDFQTRRLNIRFRNADGKIIHPHTISSTALTDRHLIAILENYQQKDGSVEIPSVLRPYFNGRDKIA